MLRSLLLLAILSPCPAMAWSWEQPSSGGYSGGYESGYSGGLAPGPQSRDPYARGYRDGLDDSDDEMIEQEERQQRGG